MFYKKTQKNQIRDASVTVGGNFHVGDVINIVNSNDPRVHNLEGLLALANRREQDEIIKQNCRGKGVSIVFIHAHNEHRPDLYLDRLHYFKLVDLLGINGKTVERFNFSLPLVFENDTDFENRLISTITNQNDYQTIKGYNTIDSLRKRKRGVSMFCTDISEHLRSPCFDKILHTHLDFWLKQQDFGRQEPLIVITFCKYPPISFFRNLFHDNYQSQMKRTLSSLQKKSNSVVILPEFSNIKQWHVDEWLNQLDKHINQMIKTPLDKKIEPIFRNSSSISLQKFAFIATEVINNNK